MMKRQITRVLGSLLFLPGALAYGAAALYYVAPGGSAWDCGGTPATACNNISTVVNNTLADEVTIKMAAGVYTDGFIVNANDLQVLNISAGWDTGFTRQSCQAEATTLEIKEGLPAMSADAPTWSTLAIDLSCLTIKSVRPTNRVGLDLDVTGGSLSLNMRELIFEHIAGSAISVFTTSAGSLSIEIEKAIFRNAYQPDGASKWPGGAIYSDAYGGSIQTITLDNSLFYNNLAIQGAALNVAAYDTASSIDVSVTNSTLSGNNSIGPDIGGAINVVATGTSQATVNLTNSIVWGNENSGVIRDLYITDFDSALATVNARYSDIGEVSLPQFNPGIYNDNGNNLNVDPLLNSRYRLNDSSPVIDQAQCGYSALNVYFRVAPYDDIDGEKRPGYGVIGGCDMGADEASSMMCVPFKSKAGKVGVFCL